MKRLLLVMSISLALGGCATSDYFKYAEAQAAIQAAKSGAEAARYQAIATIGSTGDITAKVAAMFALQSLGTAQTQATHVAAPKSAADSVREWASILVPGLVQGYTVHSNTQLGMQQSDNATALGISTNSTFLGMGAQIQAPAANVTLSGTGVLGDGSYNTDSHAITDSYNPVDSSNQGNPVQNYPQP
jgi:hypothetical protein